MVKLWNMLQQLPTMFDSIILPEALDHDAMVNSILFEAAELPPIYTDPVLLKQMINHYFQTRLAIHNQLVSVLSEEYDPIENYNRYEERTTSGTNAVNRTVAETVETSDSGTSSETSSGTANSTTTGNSTGEVENKISAFNSSDYQPDNHTDSSTTTETNTETSTETETSGNSSNSGTSEKTGSGTENATHSGRETSHIHGNIGVTTSQQMIESSINLLGVSDVYRYITADFIKTFCIRCY